MGGHKPPPIPDWRLSKVDGIKDLEWVRDQLKFKGLKDPWLRNEVWRYQDFEPSYYVRLRQFFLRGFKGATVLLGVTIFVDKAFGISARNHALGTKYIRDQKYAHHGDH